MKHNRIALLMRTGEAYDSVIYSKKHRPWLPNTNKDIDPETAVFYYLKYKYPTLKIDVFNINNLHKLDYKKYDKVFALFLELVLPSLKLKKEKYNKFLDNMSKIPNLVPKFSFIKFIANKCVYTSWLKRNNFPILNTTCKKTKQLKLKYFNKLQKSKTIKFLKPSPSAESKNTFILKHNTEQKNIKKYINKISKYNNLVIQNYVKSFGTVKNQELKTYWLNTDFVYSIKVIGSGMGYGEQKVIKRKPSAFIMATCKKILNKLCKKFKTPMIITRIDWGLNGNKLFINEIEHAPGTYAELFDKEWSVDRKIGDRLFKLIST